MGTKLITQTPQEPLGICPVIVFTKNSYSYAAIRPEGGELWFVTQDGDRGSWSRVPAMYWEALLEWAGEESWPTMELLS